MNSAPSAAAAALHRDGYWVSPTLLEASECTALLARLASVSVAKAGCRSLLSLPWCASLARRLHAHPHLAGLLLPDAVAVQCTLFEKSVERNWLVPWHQDLSMPVAQPMDDPAWSGWAYKEGGLFAHPPESVLESLVAVRLHVDGCTAADGPLRVVPGSHRHGRLTPEAAGVLRQNLGETACPVAQGAVMLMRPLLLHASSKSHGRSRRRVLHFLFAPPELALGLTWAGRGMTLSGDGPGIPR